MEMILQKDEYWLFDWVPSKSIFFCWGYFSDVETSKTDGYCAIKFIFTSAQGEKRELAFSGDNYKELVSNIETVFKGRGEDIIDGLFEKPCCMYCEGDGIISKQIDVDDYTEYPCPYCRSEDYGYSKLSRCKRNVLENL